MTILLHTLCKILFRVVLAFGDFLGPSRNILTNGSQHGNYYMVGKISRLLKRNKANACWSGKSPLWQHPGRSQLQPRPPANLNCSLLEQQDVGFGVEELRSGGGLLQGFVIYGVYKTLQAPQMNHNYYTRDVQPHA